MHKKLITKDLLSPLEFNFRDDKDIFMFKNTADELVQNNIPFVIRNHIPHALHTKWQDINYLSEKLKHIRLPVGSYDNSFYSIANLNTLDVTFEEYINHLLYTPLTDVQKLYLAELAIFDKYKQSSILQILNSDTISYTPFYRDALESRVFFIGKNTITQMHYHTSVEAMLSQIDGKKHICLFPPDNGLFYQMEPYPWHNKYYNWSQIIFEATNSLQFREIVASDGLLNCIEVILEPTDSLYIPIYWWHIVFGEGISSSFTDFFSSSSARKYLSFLGLRSGNHFSALKKIFKK